MNDPTPVICVLGMHRSGSSLAAQILAGNGLHTGRSRIGHSRFNTEGHLEDRFVVRTNKKLLLHLGGTWDRPPDLPENWLKDPAVHRRVERARRYRRDEVDSRRPFFFKDPRTSLLVPFWREAFGQMRYLVVLRNPDSVVRSVLRRHQEWLRPKRIGWRLARSVYHRAQGAFEPLRPLDYDQVYALWHHYYEKVVDAVRGCESSVLVYERLLTDPRHEIRRAVRELGIRRESVEIGMVKPQLNHSRQTQLSVELLEMERRLLASRADTESEEVLIP